MFVLLTQSTSYRRILAYRIHRQQILFKFKLAEAYHHGHNLNMKVPPIIMQIEIYTAMIAKVRFIGIDYKYSGKSPAAGCNCNYCQDCQSHKLRHTPHHIS